MKNIWLETQGVKGGKTQTKEVIYENDHLQICKCY